MQNHPQPWKEDDLTKVFIMELNVLGVLNGCACTVHTLRQAQEDNAFPAKFKKASLGLSLAWVTAAATKAWVIGRDIVRGRRRQRT